MHKPSLASLLCAIITLFLHKLLSRGWFCAGLGRLLHKLLCRDGFCAGLWRLLHKLHNPSGSCFAQNIKMQHRTPPARVPCGAGDAKKSPCAKGTRGSKYLSGSRLALKFAV